MDIFGDPDSDFISPAVRWRNKARAKIQTLEADRDKRTNLSIAILKKLKDTEASLDKAQGECQRLKDGVKHVIGWLEPIQDVMGVKKAAEYMLKLQIENLEKLLTPPKDTKQTTGK